MTRSSLAALLAAALMLSHAHAADGVSLNPILSVQAAPGTQSTTGQVELMLPYVLEKGVIAFGDLRASTSGNGLYSASLGAGLRAQQPNGWTLGAHAYFDTGNTASGHTYQQLSGGLELLGDTWEFRLNGYVPVGTTANHHDAASAVWAANGRLQMRQGYEVALYGVDAEAGIRLPVFAEGAGQSLKLFAGAFAYDSAMTDPVSGVSARAEWQVADLHTALPGASLTLGASARYDSSNALSASVFARLSAPIGGPTPQAAGADALTRRVERKTAITTAIGAYGTLQQARLANGRSYTTVGTVSAATGNMAAINAEIARLGDGALILASGDIAVDETLALASNQLFVGGGGRIGVVGEQNGRAAVLVNPGTATTLKGQGVDVVRLASGSELSQLAITGGNNAVVGSNVANVAVSSLNITGSGGNGIALNNVDGARITDTRIADLFICENNNACEFSVFNPAYVPHASINAVGVRDLTVRNVSMSNVTYGIFAAAVIDDGPWPPVTVSPLSNLRIENVSIANTRREGLLTVGADGIAIDRLSIDNSGLHRDMDMVVFQNSTNIAMRNSALRGGVNGLMFAHAGVINEQVTAHALVENVSISDTSRAGIFLNPSQDVTFRNVSIENAGTYGVYFHGDAMGFAGGPLRNITFDEVDIGTVGDAALYVSGPLENVAGTIDYADSDPHCQANTGPWSGTAITQPGGGTLSVNGTAVTDANLASGCR